jgi:hypothetical protein
VKVRGWLKAPDKFLFELCVGSCPDVCDRRVNGYNARKEIIERIAIWELLLEIHAEANGHSWPIRIDFGNSLATAIVTWPNSKLLDVLMRTGTETSGSILLADVWEGKIQELRPFSPLQLAVKYGYFETVKTLLKNGANVNEAAGRRNGGYIPLGADVNACAAMENGRTALQQAFTSYYFCHFL